MRTEVWRTINMGWMFEVRMRHTVGIFAGTLEVSKLIINVWYISLTRTHDKGDQIMPRGMAMDMSLSTVYPTV